MVAAPPKDRVLTYAEGVLSGEIVAGELVKLACERHLRDLEEGAARGLRWSQEDADDAIDFFGLLRQSKGRWANQPLQLLPWQQFVVGSVFGWQALTGQCPFDLSWSRVDPESGGVRCLQCSAIAGEDVLRDPVQVKELRRFREAYTSVARKQGKTTMAAGVGLYMLDFDGEPVAEVYASATKRDQAKQCWDEAARMVAKTPALQRRVTVTQSRAHMLVRETGSIFSALGADADSEHGLNPHCPIIDELHVARTRDLVDALETALGAREQPLIWYITTAGLEGESIYTETDDRARAVVRGVLPDDAMFVYIASIDESDDWRDTSVYAKANPSLGMTVQLDELLKERDKAEAVPGRRNSFQRLRLNMRTSQETAWLDVQAWDGCALGALSRLETPRPRVMGVDLGGNRDLSAAAIVFPDEDGDGFDVLAHFWMPKGKIQEASERDQVPYQAWIDEGYITALEGDYRDDDALLEELVALGSEHAVAEVCFDAWQWGYHATQMESRGITVVKIPQTFPELGPPTEAFENAILRKELGHLADPVLRWMVANVSVDEHPEGWRKPSKSGALKRRKHIDGISAMVTALARVLRMQGGPAPSIYETRGLRSFT